ncbi:translation initiation factor eIF-3 [Blastocystis sp. ATCC 50177/Nand II]|uniref:Translation initiation factor eIF-3 n=1 Tax=Blastocystis sp. subtype 1 (strain ATCC 50177 / NandII) TaxID=478820 RepID=A0A196S853_BLAHN|nr:translation initiation factor eIF-3 [Blastocystis sp. ATCC 50177/Nand II]
MSSAPSPNPSESNASSAEENVINLEVLALIQIVKHAQESAPASVSGQLLGLVDGSHVEVTYSYGMPVSEGDLQQVNASDFQDKMIKSLSQINVDNAVVGWYTSTFMNSFYTPQLVLTQYEYQLNLSNKTVALVIDAFDLSKGKLNLKAYRLTQQFMTLFKEGKINIEDLKSSRFTSTMILEEVPIRCCVNEVAAALLQQLKVSSITKGIVSLPMNPTTSLEKNMEQLIESMDVVINERKEYPDHVWKASKQKHSAWVAKRLGEDMDDIADVDTEDPVFAQMEQNDRVDPLLNYCALKDLCQRVKSVTTDDSKVLEKQL